MTQFQNGFSVVNPIYTILKVRIMGIHLPKEHTELKLTLLINT